MSRISAVQRWKQQAKKLKVEIYTLYLAYKDPRVPWYAKAFVALVVGYALSPIDLIPDFIPVLGYVDDLILIPLGVVLALRIIPNTVLEECRSEAQRLLNQDRPKNWIAFGLIVAIWVTIIIWLASIAFRYFRQIAV